MNRPWYFDMCREGHIRAVAKEARNLMRRYRNDGLNYNQARAEVRRIIVREFGLGDEGWTNEGLAVAFPNRGR